MAAMDEVRTVLEGLVADGRLAGAVALSCRHGEAAEAACAGWADIAAAAPMTRGTIMRIASLTKPITSTAALMLYDQGLLDLEEPISRWAPEFAQMRVLSNPAGALEDTQPAEREITFLDLLTHRSGLTYGGFHGGPLGEAYAAALGMDIDSHLSPDRWVTALAGLPLIDQPGAGFHYGASVDLLGFLIARIAGVDLGELLAQRIFRPLGMADTGFTVPADRRARRARMYGFDADGALEVRPVHPPQGGAFLAERPEDLTYVSGGAGLWSTADDYLKFARMFVGDGQVDGVRLLKVGTLRRMTANFLTDTQAAEARLMGMPVFTGLGFGLGVAVVTDPARAPVIRCRGGIGTVGWPGAYGGWWQADPNDGSVLVFLAQNALDFDQAALGRGLGVYEAIEWFHALASTTPR